MNKIRFGVLAFASLLLVALVASLSSAYIDYSWTPYREYDDVTEYSHYVKQTPYSRTESTVEKTPWGTKSSYSKIDSGHGNPYVNPASNYWSNGMGPSYTYRYVSNPYYSDRYHSGYYNYYYSPRWNGNYYDHRSDVFYYRVSI